jgi:DegV family protein with EDD domain
MELTSHDIYNSMIHGAYNVIKNKEVLNRINVFPVQDGDTGSNLSSMMRHVIQQANKNVSVKKTVESVADSALYGARGNSGIIFASYLGGLSEAVSDLETITVEEYAKASHEAFDSAYHAIENPVEGTMITIMREWGEALLSESKKNSTIKDIFINAYEKVEKALEKTKMQLEALRKANVVDSGAKGFTYFIEGAIYYIKTRQEADVTDIISDETPMYEAIIHEDSSEHEKYRYCTECLLKAEDFDKEALKGFLATQGDSTVVASNKNKCRIHVHTNHPAKVFDYLYDMGTIEYQKVDDMERQKAVVNNRKYDIALVTDSIADIPKALIDQYQIHLVYLNILYEDRVYMDKLTIESKRILDLAESAQELPTSSLPSPMQIENLFSYLSTYYSSAIVMTVSKELSGTYNVFNKIAEKFDSDQFKISVINTLQNSGAEGLLVKSCAELIDQGLSHEQLVHKVQSMIPNSKILVQVQTLDSMIKSGRLSVRAGKIGKRIGMKPIVTLDEVGKGALEGIAFSLHGSRKKVEKHLKKILKRGKIKEYAIVHIDNESGAKELAVSTTQIIGFEPSYIEETSSIVAVGAGRGAVAISYILD